jgi:hypothetical protein
MSSLSKKARTPGEDKSGDAIHAFDIISYIAEATLIYG